MNIADLSMGPANYFIYRERSRTFQPRGSCRNFFRHGVRRASHSYACWCWPAARSMQERGSASVASTQNDAFNDSRPGSATVGVGPFARRPPRRHLDGVPIGVETLDETVNPSEAQRLTNQVFIGHRLLTRMGLVKDEPDSGTR